MPSTETQQDIVGTFFRYWWFFKKFTSNINRAATKEGYRDHRRLEVFNSANSHLIWSVILPKQLRQQLDPQKKRLVVQLLVVYRQMGTDFAKASLIGTTILTLHHNTHVTNHRTTC